DERPVSLAEPADSMREPVRGDDEVGALKVAGRDVGGGFLHARCVSHEDGERWREPLDLGFPVRDERRRDDEERWTADARLPRLGCRALAKAALWPGRLRRRWGRESPGRALFTREHGSALPALLQPEEQRDDLDRLAEAHVVGEARAQPQAIEQREPADADFLVRSQLGAQRTRPRKVAQAVGPAQAVERLLQPRPGDAVRPRPGFGVPACCRAIPRLNSGRAAAARDEA